jgi:hypothetical protein
MDYWRGYFNKSYLREPEISMRFFTVVVCGLLSMHSQASTLGAIDSTRFRKACVGIEFVGLTNRGLITFSAPVVQIGATYTNVKGGFGFNRFVDFKNNFSPDYVLTLGVQVEHVKFKNVRLDAGFAIASIRAISPKRETLFGSTSHRYTSISPYSGLGYQYAFGQSNFGVALNYYFIYDSNERSRHSLGLSLLYHLK